MKMKLDKKSKEVVESSKVSCDVDYVKMFDVLAEEAAHLTAQIDAALTEYEEVVKKRKDKKEK